MKVCDMHCDTLYELEDARFANREVHLLDNHLNISLNKMKQGDYLLQTFAIFTHLMRNGDPEKHVARMIDIFYNELELNTDLKHVLSYKDIEEAMNN